MCDRAITPARGCKRVRRCPAPRSDLGCFGHEERALPHPAPFRNDRHCDRLAARAQLSHAAWLGAGALAVVIALRPAPIWIAALVITAALVLTLEMINSALEYLLDHLHPEHHPAIGAAKDAAAGAVLLASIAALAVGGLMMWDTVGWR